MSIVIRIIPILFLVLVFFSCDSEKPVPKHEFKDVVRMDSVLFHVHDTDSLWINFYALNSREQLKEDVILVVHGGGFMGGSRNSPTIDAFCKQAAASGFKVASMDYRLTLKGSSFGCDQTIENKIAAIEAAAKEIWIAEKFVRGESEMRGMSDRMFLLGNSAGAEAALHAVYAPSLEEDRADHRFDGLISLAGAMIDTSWIQPENATASLFFHGTCDPLVPYASAIHHYCPEDSPGALMLHGSWSIAQRLNSLGTPWSLNTFCGEDHKLAATPFLEHPDVLIEFCRDVADSTFLPLHVVNPGASDCEVDPGFCGFDTPM